MSNDRPALPNRHTSIDEKRAETIRAYSLEELDKVEVLLKDALNYLDAVRDELKLARPTRVGFLRAKTVAAWRIIHVVDRYVDRIRGYDTRVASEKAEAAYQALP